MRRRERIAAWAIAAVVYFYLAAVLIAARHRIAASWRENPAIAAPAPGRTW